MRSKTIKMFSFLLLLLVSCPQAQDNTTATPASPRSLCSTARVTATLEIKPRRVTATLEIKPRRVTAFFELLRSFLSYGHVDLSYGPSSYGLLCATAPICLELLPRRVTAFFGLRPRRVTVFRRGQQRQHQRLTISRHDA